MSERAPPGAQSGSVLRFETGRSPIKWIVPIGAFAVAGLALAFAPDSSAATSGGAVIGCILLAIMFSLIASSRWIAEIDLRTQTIRLSKRSFGRWTRVVDRPFDQCRALGRIEYETDGHRSYGVYVELTDGTRHAIPLKDSSFEEAGHVASQLTDATGITRLDTKF
jgi:hypothetical protein